MKTFTRVLLFVLAAAVLTLASSTSRRADPAPRGDVASQR